MEFEPRAAVGIDPQIADEVEAYNPLIPNGNEPVATVMFEIDDAEERTRIRAGIEHPNYGHVAQIPAAMRQILAEDFDT